MSENERIGGKAMTAWLRCRLDMGMFSDEVAVTYPAAAEPGYWQKSVFVPSTCVRKESGNTGKVKVVIIVKEGQRFAVLPSSQRDIVTPAEADITQR
jgi:hypothetical protein